MTGSLSAVTPCFTPGTRVAAENGVVPVEAISPGMRIHTRDNGLQEVLWAGGREVSYRDMIEARDLRPVWIRADAFGPGAPAHDIEVSPDHRILVNSARIKARFLEPEVLIAARHLVNGASVVWADMLGTRYVHLMFAQHQVILSDGLWSESFRPEARVLDAMAPALRRQVETVVGDTGQQDIANSPARHLAG